MSEQDKGQLDTGPAVTPIPVAPSVPLAPTRLQIAFTDAAAALDEIAALPGRPRVVALDLLRRRLRSELEKNEALLREWDLETAA